MLGKRAVPHWHSRNKDSHSCTTICCRVQNPANRSSGCYRGRDKSLMIVTTSEVSADDAQTATTQHPRPRRQTMGTGCREALECSRCRRRVSRGRREFATASTGWSATPAASPTARYVVIVISSRKCEYSLLSINIQQTGSLSHEFHLNLLQVVLICSVVNFPEI